MPTTVRLWIRTDGQPPKAIAITATRGPGPGIVVDVQARSAVDARATYALSCQSEPDRRTQKALWCDWETARERVQEVKA